MSSEPSARDKLLLEVDDQIDSLRERYEEIFRSLGHRLDIEPVIAPRFSGVTKLGIILEAEPLDKGKGLHAQFLIPTAQERWFSKNWRRLVTPASALSSVEAEILEWLKEIRRHGEANA